MKKIFFILFLLTSVCNFSFAESERDIRLRAIEVPMSNYINIDPDLKERIVRIENKIDFIMQNTSRAMYKGKLWDEWNKSK